MTMKKAGKALSCMAGGLLLCSGAGAGAVSSNPYESITERNVFDLHAAPPPPDVNENKPQPALKVFLTGITTILGNKRALLKTPAPAGKPGEGPKGEQSYILTEGQREGEIEVLQIDEKAGTVKIDNGGTIVVLNFDKDGQKPSVGMPAPAPGVPSPMVPPPTGFNGGVVNPAHQAGGFNLPTRPLRAQPAGVNPSGGSYPGGGGYPSGAGYPVNGGIGGGVPNAFMNYGGGSAAQAQVQAASQAPAISPEQQIIQMEALREVNKNNPNFPPLPPTPLNPNPTGTGAESPATTTPGVPGLPRPPGFPQQLPPMPQ